MTTIIIEVASLITAVTVIIKAFDKIFDEKIEPLSKSIAHLDENHCKDFLVTFLERKERGDMIDEVEMQRAYEVYDHYTNDLKLNSYIHDKWNKLMK